MAKETKKTTSIKKKAVEPEKVDTPKSKYTPAIGRRKSSTARVRLAPGQGQITVNEREFSSYFPQFNDQVNILSPLEAVGQKTKFDVRAKVLGGGRKGQADAIKLGIARALIKYDEAYKPALRAAGLLTRDPREKERKKPGLKKARRAPQWSKR